MLIEGTCGKYTHYSLYWLSTREYFTDGVIAMSWYSTQKLGNSTIYHFTKAPVKADWVFNLKPARHQVDD